MNIPANQAATSALFKKFQVGLLKLQQENEMVLNGKKLIGCCFPYFSKYSAGILYRRDMSLPMKNKIRRLLMGIFFKGNGLN